MATNKIRFSDEDEKQIIEFVKSNEVLYNMKHKHFRDSEAKNRLWCTLACEMAIPADALRRKWGTMRDYYNRTREKRTTDSQATISRRDKRLSFLQQKSILQQIATEKMPRPKNHLLHSFFHKTNNDTLLCNIRPCTEKKLSTHSANLQRHLKQFHPKAYANYIHEKTTGLGNDTFSNIKMEEEDTLVFDPDNLDHPKITIKDFEETIIATPIDNTEVFADAFAPQYDPQIKSDPNLIQKASELWTLKLQNMNPTQALLAEKLINDVIYNGQMGVLNQNSSVQIGFQ